MSFIPNTTPTPNWLYNGEMKKMSDTELRIVLVVTRATLGWIVDENTGMRKEQDWISRSQMIEKTGRGKESVNKSITNCVKKGWIEVRDKDGNILKTPRERSGKKLYYRLGMIFINKITSPKSGQDENQPKKQTKPAQKVDQNQPKKWAVQKKYLQKKYLQKKDGVNLKKFYSQKKN